MSKTSARTRAKRSATGKNSRDTTSRTRPPTTGAVAKARGSSRGPRRGALIAGALVTAFAVVVLYLVYQSSEPSPDTSAGGSGYHHVAGEPGIGDTAPGFTLPSSNGGEVSLADYRGQSVLLYFQEGLMCQPCVDQITDLESNEAALTEAGVDEVVSISHDPIHQVARKAADEQLSTPWLSDPSQEVIHAYDAHKYGMMNETTAGHSFVLVGPDGTIQWRADYGGAPDYTMFVPTEKMLADLAQERAS
ncbi:peroxiredoxin Q/BCP [Amycolatopsis arida]|uniref:Peroxiredoxin Q/BCP n=1 Tax=Amycolatopsis arida TaxID=587909 RepID=A0A1I5M705_9PSEU|nr:peroxiredoxin family protein [Amycolatopsis arida]TDX93992.1 peroxiredoxin Q/BCP [Amycolatopsis arida]SFP05309.1 peroxiredoxin Q/BCP [Amycolatopsis arida]